MTRAILFRHFGSLAAATAVTAGGLWAVPAQGQVATPVAAAPAVGDNVRDFTLQTLDGATVRVTEELARGPVVLVVLRGWPGYQCPFCTRQFGDYRTNAPRLDQAGARVLFVYPGPADGLRLRAEAFTATAPLPVHFRVLLDPDYSFTDAYGLRWDAPGETAYPSTFVITPSGMVVLAEVSRAHGDRVPVAAVLDALGRSR